MSSEDKALLDRFYQSLVEGDIDSMTRCCSPDLEVWHNFDGVVQDLAESVEAWKGLVAAFSVRKLVDARTSTIDGGIVRRHMVIFGNGPDNPDMAKPCCVFVKVRNGLITRIDEYIDLSTNLELGDSEATPGLAKESAIV